MSRPSFFLIAVALSLFASECLAQGIYLRLKSEAVVTLPTVRLSDVAAITENSGEPGLEQKLAHIVVAYFGDTASKTLTRQDIERTLFRNSPALQDSVAWGGADFVTIRGGAQSIDLTKKIDQLANQVIEVLESHWGTVELTLVNRPAGKLEVPAVAKVEEILSIEKAVWTANEIRVPIQIFVEGKKYTETMVKFRWRARQELQRVSQEIVGKDAKPGAADNPLPSVVSLQPQTVENVKFLIQKGQRVHLIIHEGHIDIESEGVAVSGANMGELVKVRRGDGSDLLVGRVRGPDTVVVGSDVDA